ncbi:hypothetical protein P4571_08675 [Niallia alba]|nr:hypothetical protein [Niallia alba]
MGYDVIRLNEPNHELMLKGLIRLVENCEAMEKQSKLKIEITDNKSDSSE